jgi:transposase
MDRPPQIVLQRKSRTELERLLADGNTAQKIAKRARIVLMSADDHGVMAIMREVGISKTTVWRWQEYFVEAGVDGLVKGRGKPPGKKPISTAIKLKIVEKTVKERPANATHWSVRTMAEESQPHERATDLGRARAQAASGEELQDLQRPRFPQKG